MIKFRWHRGTLEDSLATTMEFKSLTELKTYIYNEVYKDLPEFMLHPVEEFKIKIKDYGYDDRCRQNLWIVLCSQPEKVYFPMGFICEDVE